MEHSFSLEGKSVVVAGGTRGIGRAISLQAARSGARVIAIYVRNEKAAGELEAISSKEKLDINYCRADLTSTKGLNVLKESITGEVSGLVYCAASGVHKPIDQLTGRHFDFTYNLNIKAFFNMVQLLLPSLSKSSSIIGLSSEGAVHAYPTYSLVGSTKGALESLCRHMAVEFAGMGIRVNILSPGSVLTDSWEAFPDKEDRMRRAIERNPQNRMTTPEEVAYTAHFLLSDASKGINGHTLVVDGGQRIRG